MAAQQASLAPAAADAEIIVRATKRDLTLANVPLAATIVPVDGTSAYDPRKDSQRVAEQVEGLSLTGEGPGRNRMFLRGVADSPFGGKSQATVAILLDDARITYAAPDPDIRLVDVDRVEILKGPQGSLYGSGAIGGIYRIVTKRADPSAFSVAGSVAGESIATGELGGSASLVVNIPLMTDVAGLRLVAYGEQSPGWLNTGDRADSNRVSTAGLRAGLGIEAGGGWRADVTGFGQWLQAHDSNYTYAPEAHVRPPQLPEPHQNDLVLGSLRLAREGSTEIVLSTAYTVHDVDDRYDATQGADNLGLPGPQTLDDSGNYRLWDSEGRISGNWRGLGWLGGIAYVGSGQDSSRVLEGAAGDALTLEKVKREASEAALFGEATLPLSATLDATLGGRLFHTSLHEKRTTEGEQGIEETRHTGITPSVSLAWHSQEGRLLYLRYGSAVRQGGTTVGATGAVQPLDEDELMTIEGGWRQTMGPLDIDLGLYHSWWRDIQSDILLADGLVETANVGDGAITGAELSVKALLAEGWRLDGGAMAQSAMLTHDNTGLELHDRRLPVVPSWTLRAALAHDFTFGRWNATATAGARYIGPGRLSFDLTLDRPLGNYLETNVGLQARLGVWSVGLEGRNLVNARGDSFVYGNPLRIFSSRQFVRQDPLSVRFSITLAP